MCVTGVLLWEVRDCTDWQTHLHKHPTTHTTSQPAAAHRKHCKHWWCCCCCWHLAFTKPWHQPSTPTTSQWFIPSTPLCVNGLLFLFPRFRPVVLTRPPPQHRCNYSYQTDIHWAMPNLTIVMITHWPVGGGGGDKKPFYSTFCMERAICYPKWEKTFWINELQTK